LWRSNNWGAPKLDIKREQKANDIFKTCKEKCETLGHDEILLYGLESELKNHSRENMFVVLHQVGSHGPLYYEKYPQNFEIFKPTCKSVQLQNCTHEELINAYDNTIAYTDYFLHKLILLLSSLKKTSSVMIYISDHGESLGEYNFYLHGTPYSIAPDFQKQIPFLIWMSDEFKRRHHLTNKDLTQFAKDYSQDNIFHSVMGAFGMRSGIYDKKLDVFQ
jgi:lipid A ethanolaminephosphotransferase